MTAQGWTVLVGTRVVGVFADLDAAVAVADDLDGAVVPWRPPQRRGGQQAIEGRAA